MTLYIADISLNNNLWKFEPIEYIEEFTSIIWTERWQKCGDFVLTLPSSSLRNFDSYDDLIDKMLVLKNEKVPREGEKITYENEYMFIESYSVVYDADDVDTLTLQGKDLTSILARRIVWGQRVYTNQTIKQICNDLVDSQIVNPEAVSSGNYRKIVGFSATNYDADDIINNIQFTGDNLLDALIAVCGTDYTPRIKTFYNNRFRFDLYKGIVRPIVFSQDLDNLERYEEIEDISEYKNAWLVGGEGEGIFRRYVDYSWEGGKYQRWGAGLFRREKFVDARDVSSNDGEIGEADYNAMLQQRGMDKRLETWVERDGTAEIVTNNLKYKTDYLVGDIITIIDTLNNKHQARITEFIRCEDADGYKEYPNFEFI